MVGYLLVRGWHLETVEPGYNIRSGQFVILVSIGS